MTCQKTPPQQCIVCSVNAASGVITTNVCHECFASRSNIVMKGWWCHRDGTCRQEKPVECNQCQSSPSLKGKPRCERCDFVTKTGQVVKRWCQGKKCKWDPPVECIVCNGNAASGVGVVNVCHECVGSGTSLVAKGWWCHRDGTCRQQKPVQCNQCESSPSLNGKPQCERCDILTSAGTKSKGWCHEMTCQKTPPQQCIVCSANAASGVSTTNVCHECFASRSNIVMKGWWCHRDRQCRQHMPLECTQCQSPTSLNGKLRCERCDFFSTTGTKSKGWCHGMRCQHAPPAECIVCPVCAPTKGCSRNCVMSCCARGGSWFKTCCKPGANCEHTWTEGIQACKRKFKCNHKSHP